MLKKDKKKCITCKMEENNGYSLDCWTCIQKAEQASFKKRQQESNFGFETALDGSPELKYGIWGKSPSQNEWHRAI